MQGSFLTEDYRNSAGKHRFASPQMIFLTEQLDQIHGIESKSGDEICVVVVVQAKSEGSDFEKRWATHASYCLSICPKYTRNRVVPLKYSQIGTIFAGTQFDPSRVVASGGYEEFCFGGHAEAEDFFHRYGNKLGESYSQFLDDTQSCCYAFDRLVQFADSDRGLWQKAFGLVVSTGLRAKVYWGLP
ncbi:hypothetical protein N7476_004533 [Penicillium atrosanguineum]|uniref:Uncharacterized protein n=2 Tax=Penicillium atrosanguineum TaxID=1132637 RepID=A0A9W9Q085_9EURO|nr:hypothetical protein N7476_004533 [Penicillium atrosanguineum]